MDRSALIIPTETQIREFDAKLLVACVAAERGFRSIVGARLAIHARIHRMPRCIYLAKDVKPASRRMLRIISGLGNRIIALDEEGLVVASAAHYWETRLDPDAITRVDTHLTWGQEEAENIESCPHRSGAPIHVTGNPRTDLMRPALRNFHAPEIESIQRRFGRPILINTNFGPFNPYFPSLLRSSAAARSARKKKPLYAVGKLNQHREKIFEEFKKLVPALSQRFADAQVVIRPHPGENPEFWKELTAPLPNVHVAFEWSVTPWLFACAAMVHNGCTTAVEAAIQGVPAISYEPADSHLVKTNLPSSLSTPARSREELFERLAEALSGSSRHADCIEPSGADAPNPLERHVAGLQGPLVAENVVNVIEHVDRELGPAPRPSRSSAIQLANQVRLRALEKRLVSLVPGSKHDARYAQYRFAGMSQGDVEGRIARLGAALGRFGEARVRVLSRDIFEISA